MYVCMQICIADIEGDITFHDPKVAVHWERGWGAMHICMFIYLFIFRGCLFLCRGFFKPLSAYEVVWKRAKYHWHGLSWLALSS